MDKNQRPSELFEDVIMHSGSTDVLCEFCGRMHFAANSPGDYEEGELERLRELAKEDPDKYVEHFDQDSIGWGNIDGKQAVIGCECDGLARWERWIWNHRHLIAEYLKKRSEAALKNATKELEEFNINLSEKH